MYSIGSRQIKKFQSIFAIHDLSDPKPPSVKNVIYIHTYIPILIKLGMQTGLIHISNEFIGQFCPLSCFKMAAVQKLQIQIASVIMNWFQLYSVCTQIWFRSQPTSLILFIHHLVSKYWPFKNFKFKYAPESVSMILGMWTGQIPISTEFDSSSCFKINAI